MHSLSIELIPYLFIDVFYLNKEGKITILKSEINGIRIELNSEQSQSIVDEINDVLKYDY